MTPGHYFVRSWIPQTQQGIFPGSLTIYDYGHFQGWLLEKPNTKSTWIVFQIDARIQDVEGFTEMGTIVEESQAPLHAFSIATYPMRQQSLQPQGQSTQILFSLPQAQILLTLSEESLVLPQQQQSPSVQSEPMPDVPVSHESRKSNSKTPAGERQTSQNRNRVLPTLKASPSSNPKNRVPPATQGLRKQAIHPQSPAPTRHSDHESSEHPPWTSLAQQSLYSRPPPELEGALAEQVSVSLSPKDSE